MAQSYGRLPSLVNAQVGAVSGWPGAVAASAVPSVVVLCAGSRSRQVTSVADPPAGVDRPPPLIAVVDEPGGNSWRTVVSSGELLTLRTWIRYLGAGLLSVATATVTGCGGADAGARDGGAIAGGAEGGVGSVTRAAIATGGRVPWCRWAAGVAPRRRGLWRGRRWSWRGRRLRSRRRQGRHGGEDAEAVHEHCEGSVVSCRCRHTNEPPEPTLGASRLRAGTNSGSPPRSPPAPIGCRALTG